MQLVSLNLLRTGEIFLGREPGHLMYSHNNGNDWTQVSVGRDRRIHRAQKSGRVVWALNGGTGLLRSVDDGMTWKDVAAPGMAGGWADLTIGPDGTVWALTTELKVADGRALDRASIVYSKDDGADWSTVQLRDGHEYWRASSAVIGEVWIAARDGTVVWVGQESRQTHYSRVPIDCPTGWLFSARLSDRVVDGCASTERK
jgi:hypothetical protein